MRCFVYQLGILYRVDVPEFDPSVVGFWKDRIDKFSSEYVGCTHEGHKVMESIVEACPDIYNDIRDLIWWEGISPEDCANRLKHGVHSDTIIGMTQARSIDFIVYDGKATIVPYTIENQLTQSIVRFGKPFKSTLKSLISGTRSDERAAMKDIQPQTDVYNKCPDFFKTMVNALCDGLIGPVSSARDYLTAIGSVPPWLAEKEFVCGSERNLGKQFLLDRLNKQMVGMPFHATPRDVYPDALMIWWELVQRNHCSPSYSEWSRTVCKYYHK